MGVVWLLGGVVAKICARIRFISTVFTQSCPTLQSLLDGCICAQIFAAMPPNYHTTPTFSGARRRNLDTAKLKRGNLRSSSKFAIAIVPTKQTMGVTVIIRVIIPGSKVTVQEKVGRLKPPQPPRF